MQATASSLDAADTADSAVREALLRDAAEAPPCGPDLTYDADFVALENAALGKPEQQFGDTLIPAEPPDWREVERRASQLLLRTKDLRVAVLLCRAWTGLRGLPGLAAGLGLLTGLLERHGEALHPLPEDGDDFMRTNALASLDEVTGLVRQLRDAEFLGSTLGGLSVREAESIVRGQPAGEGARRMAPEQLRMAVADGLRQQDVTLAAVQPIQQAVWRLRALFEHQGTGQRRVELGQLLALVNMLAELLPAAAVDAPAPPTEAGAPTVAGAAPTVASAPAAPAGLRTRDDAVAQLLQVAAFLERTEPTNPAPLLIRRAARLMGMGFIDILRELSPESLAQVETITGTRPPA